MLQTSRLLLKNLHLPCSSQQASTHLHRHNTYLNRSKFNNHLPLSLHVHQFSQRCYHSSSRRTKLLETFESKRSSLKKSTAFLSGPDSEVAEKIIEIICDPEQIDTLYGEIEDKTSLAYRLFQGGILPSDLTGNDTRLSVNKEGRIVFYPTRLTSQLFRDFLSGKLKENLYIMTKNSGKSHSLALLVYLLRQNKQNRVLYLHNCYTFDGNP